MSMLLIEPHRHPPLSDLPTGPHPFSASPQPHNMSAFNIIDFAKGGWDTLVHTDKSWYRALFSSQKIVQNSKLFTQYYMRRVP